MASQQQQLFTNSSTEKITQKRKVFGYEVHPAANAFPMIGKEGFAQLVADVKQNGVQQPVIFDQDDRILDGRNRLAAAERAGLTIDDVPCETFSGTDDQAIDMVVSLNAVRRHLTTLQVCEAIHALTDMKHPEDAAADATEAPAKPKAKAKAKQQTVEQLAKSMGLKSDRQVKRFRRVMRDGSPDLIKAVKDQVISINAADLICARFSKPTAQNEAVKAAVAKKGETKQKERARKKLTKQQSAEKVAQANKKKPEAEVVSATVQFVPSINRDARLQMDRVAWTGGKGVRIVGHLEDGEEVLGSFDLDKLIKSLELLRGAK